MPSSGNGRTACAILLAQLLVVIDVSIVTLALSALSLSGRHDTMKRRVKLNGDLGQSKGEAAASRSGLDCRHPADLVKTVVMGSPIPEGARWPVHLPVGALRVVRWSPRYDQTVIFYRDIIGLPVLENFQESYGLDGTIFGLPGGPVHLEIVRSVGRSQSLTPGLDQLVFYLPDPAAREQITARLAAAGVDPVAQIEYWQDNGGVTYRDPDGREVVFTSWIYQPPTQAREGRLPIWSDVGAKLSRELPRVYAGKSMPTSGLSSMGNEAGATTCYIQAGLSRSRVAARARA